MKILRGLVGGSSSPHTPRYYELPEDGLTPLPRQSAGIPLNALSTMWTWVTESRADADRALTKVLAPLLGRDPEELRAQVCVGSATHCAELLSRYDEAGCERVYLWPLGDEARQIELVADQVAPGIRA